MSSINLCHEWFDVIHADDKIDVFAKDGESIILIDLKNGHLNVKLRKDGWTYVNDPSIRIDTQLSQVFYNFSIVLRKQEHFMGIHKAQQ